MLSSSTKVDIEPSRGTGRVEYTTSNNNCSRITKTALTIIVKYFNKMNTFLGPRLVPMHKKPMILVHRFADLHNYQQKLCTLGNTCTVNGHI